MSKSKHTAEFKIGLANRIFQEKDLAENFQKYIRVGMLHITHCLFYWKRYPLSCKDIR